MDHLSLVEKAEEAITGVFSDQSVTQDETCSSLVDLQGFIQDMINTLPE